jgi:hypothetical protein
MSLNKIFLDPNEVIHLSQIEKGKVSSYITELSLACSLDDVIQYLTQENLCLRQDIKSIRHELVGLRRMLELRKDVEASK